MLTKRFFAACLTFFVPIITLSALTQLVQKDVDQDINSLKKKQSEEYKESRETNQQIFNYIMNSTKNNNQEFFIGLEKEMGDINTIRNKNLENKINNNNSNNNNKTPPTTNTPSKQ